MDIALEPKIFERATPGSITGPIWLRHEGIEFPERGWNDFPVIVLGWWLNHLAGLTRGEKTALFSFMDGPYEFAVSHETLGHCRLELIERGVEKSVVSEFAIDLATLQASLQAAAASVLAECDRRGWKDREVEDLRGAANASRH